MPASWVRLRVILMAKVTLLFHNAWKARVERLVDD